MYRLGWFSTGRDKAARDLFQIVHRAIAAGEIKAQIQFAFSNRERGEARESDSFFDLVQSYGIPLLCLSSQKFKTRWDDWRLRYDREVMSRLSRFSPDLSVLAGYMLIVGEEMCRKYTMINLHPALPGGPAGTWQEVIWKLIERRTGYTGAMMHLVTPELDKGPPVTYCTFPIRGESFDRHWEEIDNLEEVKARQGENNPLFQAIRRHGLAREFPLIVATLKAFSEGRVRIEGGRVVSERKEIIGGYDLSEEIEEAVRREAHLL